MLQPCLTGRLFLVGWMIVVTFLSVAETGKWRPDIVQPPSGKLLVLVV